MTYHVQFTTAAKKQLKKMDRFDARLLLSWIEQNLEGCSDPRVHGKELTANRTGEWRYRVGNYRILAHIDNAQVVIDIFKIGHRQDVYL